MITKKLQKFKELHFEIARHVGLEYFPSEIQILDDCHWRIVESDYKVLFDEKKENVKEGYPRPMRTFFEDKEAGVHRGKELTAIESMKGDYLIFLNSMEVKNIKE